MSRFASRARRSAGLLSLVPGLPSVIKIMPLGDSITAGAAFVESNAYYGAYRIELWRKLVTVDHYPIDFVGLESNGTSQLPDHDHQGIGGWWLKDSPYDPPTDMYSYIIDWMTATNPDVILLHGGTNELYSSRGGDLTLQHLDAMIQRIYQTKPGVRLVVANIIGRVPDEYNPQSENFDDYQAGIPALVAGYKSAGKKIYLADMHTTLNKSTDYVDILHPNAAGYAKMAAVWHTTLVNEVFPHW